MKATLFQNSEGKLYGFQISGHSEYAKSGEDILCSAVSALTITTINAIEKLTEDKPEILALNEEEGFMRFELKSVSKESEILLEALKIGLTSIEESYGKYIQVQIEGGIRC